MAVPEETIESVPEKLHLPKCKKGSVLLFLFNIFLSYNWNNC